MTQTCEMVVGHIADEHGEPGWEIECQRPARVELPKLKVRCCIACARELRREPHLLEPADLRALKAVEDAFGKLPS